MNRLSLAPLVQDKLRVEVTDSASGLLVQFTGSIDMEAPGLILDPLFSQLHEGMVAEKIPFIVADFQQLTFLNSSGIKAIARWIMKLAMLPASQRYQIRLTHNKSLAWQVTSLPTLAFLVPGAVKVE